MPEQKLKAIIVDDSLLYRMFVRDVLSHNDSIEVISSAGDGHQALEQIQLHQPDLITLDIEMPILDGISVLKKLKEINSKTQAIVLSGLTQKGAKLTHQALELGAFDFVVKPDSPDQEKNYQRLTDGLTSRIGALRQSRFFNRGSTASNSARDSEPKSTPRASLSNQRADSQKSVVVIGVSTGGPAALKEVLRRLPENLDASIMVVQHMPAIFTSALAQDLNRHCKLDVVEAQPGPIEPGKVYIAPGGKQMKIYKSSTGKFIRVTDESSPNGYKPCADTLFESAAEAYGSDVLGIVMTGMGDDGLNGCEQLKANGSMVLAQNEETCVVYGMPKKVVDAGLADEIIGLENLAQRIVANTKKKEYSFDH